MKSVYIKYSAAVILFSVLSVFSVFGQKHMVRHPEMLRFSNWEVYQVADSLFITFDLTVEKKAIKSKESLTVTPGIHGPNIEVELPDILINGKRRASQYKRERALSKKYVEATPYITMTLKEKYPQTVRYHYMILTTPEMENADLIIESYIRNCCDMQYLGSRNVLNEPLAYLFERTPIEMDVPNVNDRVSWLSPPEEKEKKREEFFQAYINYPVGVFEVRPTYGNNVQELSKIDGALSPLITNNDFYSIRNVRIDGYASPEGTWESNERLALNRGKHFWTYLTNKYRNLTRITNPLIISHSEDWDGLVRIIQEDPIPMAYKNEVLEIINRYGIFDGRESKLMVLANGEPYRFMLHTYFPKLRRMEVTFQYDVRAVDNLDAEKLLATRPGDLSQQEMLRVWKHLGKELLDGYEFAEKYFSTDPIAIINASSVALVKGDLEKAYTLLKKVENDPRAANNLGMYYWLQKDFDTARKYFRQANQTEPGKATENLQRLDAFEADQNAGNETIYHYDILMD